MNDGNQAANFLYLILLIVLVGSAFFARRIPMAQGLKMFAAWGLIFLAVFVAFTLRHDFIDLGDRVLAELRGTAAVADDGETLRIRLAEDGHFWVTAELNGEPVRFLVDSGATMTSISAATARRAGIEPSNRFPAVVQTANGTIAVQRGRVERIRLGSISREDLGVHIFNGPDDVNVIGMNFLSSLTAWGVEGRWLVLTP